MPGDLVRLSTGGHQPAQKGRVWSTAAGPSTARPVEWLIDTGSPECAIPQSIANQFALTVVAGAPRAQGVGGGVVLQYKGLTIEFTIEDATGAAKTITKAVTVRVGSTNALLGMHELAAAKAVISWDAFNGTGKLTGP